MIVSLPRSIGFTNSKLSFREMQINRCRNSVRKASTACGTTLGITAHPFRHSRRTRFSQPRSDRIQKMPINKRAKHRTSTAQAPHIALVAVVYSIWRAAHHDATLQDTLRLGVARVVALRTGRRYISLNNVYAAVITCFSNKASRRKIIQNRL